MRYVCCSLFTEGGGDEAFLVALLTRQLRALLAANAEIDRVRAEPCRTIAESRLLEPEVAASARDFDVVIVHHDFRESAKIAKLVTRLSERLPVHARIVGADVAWLPKRSADVEKIEDPKSVLKRVLGTRCLTDALRLLGENVTLDRLAEVPAYQSFLQEPTTALKELNFL